LPSCGKAHRIDRESDFCEFLRSLTAGFSCAIPHIRYEPINPSWPTALIDSSVWIDHFQKPSSRLVELLNEENVFVHPLVIGEIACGNLKFPSPAGWARQMARPLALFYFWGFAPF